VRDLAEALRQQGFQVEIGQNLSKEAMGPAFDRLFANIKPGSTSLLFFSGLGIQFDRRTYMMPSNPQVLTDSDVQEDGYNLDSVLAEMDTRGARVKIAIIDASGGGPRARRFPATPGGLASARVPTGTVVMYSAAAFVTQEGEGRKFFTRELIKEIKNPGRIEDAFSRTAMSVARATHGEQVPWFSSSLVEEFSFGTTGGGQREPVPPIVEVEKKPGPPPPDPEAMVRAEYQAAERGGTKKAFGDFLTKYPSGRHADLARQQIAKLTDAANVEALRRIPSPKPALEDPLRRGHALLIGNAKYRDTRWAPLEDVPLQLAALEKELKNHFDSVELAHNLTTDQLRQTVTNFVRIHGNDENARLFIYYAGHGYTEVIPQYNEHRGYITGIDTPWIDGSEPAYKAARLRAISMSEVRAPLQEVVAKHIFILFDSCFAGTLFTARSPNAVPPNLSPDMVATLIAKPSRSFITAGMANELVPAHSPIPDLFIAAVKGGADRFNQGVVSASAIHSFLQDGALRMRDQGIKLNPQGGKLQDPSFAEGEFLFRVTSALVAESDIAGLYRLASGGDATAQNTLATYHETGRGGLAKDEREAARLYRLSANQGNADAQYNLAIYHESGRGGLPKNLREARRLYRLAADQGHILAKVATNRLKAP
jgi:uncharacterized caspase-like protein